MILCFNIDRLLIDNIYFVGGIAFTIISTIMYVNSIIYQKHIKVFWEDIYYLDAMDNKWKIHWDKVGFSKAAQRILHMKHTKTFFIGIFSTPLLLILWFSMRKIDRAKNIGDAFAKIGLDGENYYEEYKKELKLFERLFPLLYWLIHLRKGKALWLK